MSVFTILAIIAGLGAVGGGLNSVLMGEFSWPGTNRTSGVWRPGWVGSMLVGAVAAASIWGLYTPAVTEPNIFGTTPINLTLVQAAASLFAGLSGARILALEIHKIAAQNIEEKPPETFKGIKSKGERLETPLK